MPAHRRSRPEGIVTRHGLACASHRGRSCDCRPGYQAQVWSARDQKTIRKTFHTLAEARAWRAQAKSALSLGALRAPTPTTIAEAAEAWLGSAKAGVIRTRSGDHYKPSALRSYEQVLRATVLPELGHLRLSALTRNTLQDLVDRLVGEGRSASTVRNTVLPLRAIYRRALSRSEVLINPTLGLALPASRARRERVARPAEARELIEALPKRDRALWATALYAGLRRGELRALRWADVEFEHGLTRVERSWDDRVGPIEPKSRAGRRRVPLGQPLRGYLAAHRLHCRPLYSGLRCLVITYEVNLFTGKTAPRPRDLSVRTPTRRAVRQVREWLGLPWRKQARRRAAKNQFLCWRTPSRRTCIDARGALRLGLR